LWPTATDTCNYLNLEFIDLDDLFLFHVGLFSR